MAQWAVRTTDGDKERSFDTRKAAEEAIDELEALGLDVELVPPVENGDGEAAEAVGDATKATPVGGERDATPVQADLDPAEYELPERSVGEDPLAWVPGEFVDVIDGTEAINRKGFEVLSHFYDIGVESDVQVPPEETGFEFCRVKATAVTPDGRRCEAYGSAHVDRGDDKTLLLEMADTRARKRSLSIATGVGAVAVDELRNEVER